MALLGVLRHQQRHVAADLRAIVACGPRDQNLRLGEQQCAQTVGLDLQVLDVGAQQFSFRPRAAACASTGSPPPPKSRAAPAPSPAPRFPGGSDRRVPRSPAGNGNSPACAGPIDTRTAVPRPIRPLRASDVHDSKVRRIATITPDMVCPKPHDFHARRIPAVRSRIERQYPLIGSSAGKSPDRERECVAKNAPR